MIIRRIRPGDVQDVAHLAHELWPNLLQPDLVNNFTTLLPSEEHRVYICRLEDQAPVAFLHVSLRKDYVEGTSSSPVGYVEGIYVRSEYRNQGIARNLVERAESWAKDNGCKEMASDSELLNLDSQHFHEKLGYHEVNKIVCYSKPLTESQQPAA